jgi:hypothetical protein
MVAQHPVLTKAISDASETAKRDPSSIVLDRRPNWEEGQYAPFLSATTRASCRRPSDAAQSCRVPDTRRGHDHSPAHR